MTDGDPEALEILALESQARGGDRRAATTLAESFRPALQRVAYRYVRNVHDAEDITQDAITALLSRDVWPEGATRTWLVRAVRFRCLDARKGRRSARVARGGWIGDVAPPRSRTGPHTAVARQEQHDELRRHIDSLTDDQAEVIALRYLDGLTRGEIADTLEVPLSVVKSRLYEAKKSLRALWRVHE